MQKITFPYYMLKAQDFVTADLKHTWPEMREAFWSSYQQCPALILGASGSIITPTHYVSVQASMSHYCVPRKTLPYNHYEAFEIGYPATPNLSAIEPYGDTDWIYSAVPVAAVQQFIDDNGGIIGFLHTKGDQRIPMSLTLTDEEITYFSLR